MVSHMVLVRSFIWIVITYVGGTLVGAQDSSNGRSQEGRGKDALLANNGLEKSLLGIGGLLSGTC